MAKPFLLKPGHKAIKACDQALAVYHERGVKHEGALETAFGRLLNDTAKAHGWTLVPKEKLKVGAHTIFPDGTLHETLFNQLRRGYWEAKDTDDHLDAEISKKLAKGYPRNNTIFEDTRTAVLYQGGVERYRLDLTKPAQLCALLNEFYAWTDPEIESFEQAVDEFKEQVPALALGLVKILAEAHDKDRGFQTAFESFYAVCQQTLNANIRREAVDEMLVQHLLTERLIRTVFNNPDFTRRNVIAAEVEKVIDALVKHALNRDDFLRKLDRFYRAIENAAHTLTDFSEKQHFLNTVYERFFQGYSVKLADTHGIVYTPQEIVDFMCASIEEVLQKDFALTLGAPGVNILDPCTGTGNFIVNLINRIPKRDLRRVYHEQLFANEVMLLPYYIAALNIEHAYYDHIGEYEAFDGLCFVDTLELAESEHGLLSFMTEQNTQRVERLRKSPITVIIGNPPYNAWQLDENDNNKNRKYPVIDRRIKETYAKDSTATNKNALSDAYVKFFRWAVDRLGNRDGIVCFVSNNSFVDQITFDGMRKHLSQDFTTIYHVHLEGNVRHNPKLAGTTYNVFGIQVGVGITVAVRSARQAERRILFWRVDKLLRKEEKLRLLDKVGNIAGPVWTLIVPDDRQTWLGPENTQEFGCFLPVGHKEAKGGKQAEARTVFKSYGRGVATCRDDIVYGPDRDVLVARVHSAIEDYNAEVDRFRRKSGKVDIDRFVHYEKVKWSESLKANLERGRCAVFDEAKIRLALYRPYCHRFLFFDDVLNERRYQFPQILPTVAAERENCVVALSDIGFRAQTFSALITNSICDLHLCATTDGHQCFPFYVYDEDGSNRRENITDWALEQFRTHYGDKKIGKWDIFYNVYGILHHPGYRTKFADNLKRELPRIPFPPDFAAFAKAGQELARLHLNYEKLEPYRLKWIETEGVPLSYCVEDKMRLSKDKTALKVNPSLTLAGIPPLALQYRLGNRSALEWVIDQYQVSADKRSGIRSDPNRPDDEEYIVRLVGQIIHVSLETVRIVSAFPERYTD